MKGFKMEIKAGVGMVFNEKGQVLMGKAISKDERNGKWVFPGGGVDGNESPLQTSIREVYEETGVSAQPMLIEMIHHPTKPFVGFFTLKADGEQVLKANEEFSELKWYGLGDIPKDTLELNKSILGILYKKVV